MDKLLIGPSDIRGQGTTTRLPARVGLEKICAIQGEVSIASKRLPFFLAPPLTRISLLYPGDFLSETERTLSLLFPPANFEASKRTRRIGEKDHVDIEAAIESSVASDEMLDLSNYPYWQERLREVQKAYDHARPKTLKQWWFDRRHRFEWATFWTAVVVFILTLIFGLIASITGIIQVYAAFKALQ
jgi:hypothetical protein